MQQFTMQQKQQALTKQLKDLTELLEKEHINYFVSSGSCLGVIRHGGFIPWDDDIDILMFREDYEKFLSLKPEEPYFIAKPGDEGNIFPFAKFYNKNIEIIEPYSTKKYAESYLYVDVFPLDYMPENDIERAKLIKKASKLRHGVSHILIEGNTPLKRLIKNALRLFRGDRALKRMNRKLDNLGLRQKTAYCMDLVWGNKCVKTEYFDNYEVREFEGVPVRIPADWNAYLTDVYGDYMKLPPEEDRYTHGLIAFYADGRK